jgi:hypothetical protein
MSQSPRPPSYTVKPFQGKRLWYRAHVPAAVAPPYATSFAAPFWAILPAIWGC